MLTCLHIFFLLPTALALSSVPTSSPKSQLQQLSSMTILSVDSSDLEFISDWALTGLV